MNFNKFATPMQDVNRGIYVSGGWEGEVDTWNFMYYLFNYSVNPKLYF